MYLEKAIFKLLCALFQEQDDGAVLIFKKKKQPITDESSTTIRPKYHPSSSAQNKPGPSLNSLIGGDFYELDATPWGSEDENTVDVYEEMKKYKSLPDDRDYQKHAINENDYTTEELEELVRDETIRECARKATINHQMLYTRWFEGDKKT